MGEVITRANKTGLLNSEYQNAEGTSSPTKDAFTHLLPWSCQGYDFITADSVVLPKDILFTHIGTGEKWSSPVTSFRVSADFHSAISRLFNIGLGCRCRGLLDHRSRLAQYSCLGLHTSQYLIIKLIHFQIKTRLDLTAKNPAWNNLSIIH